MINILDEVNELKELILNSSEYKNYKNYLELLEENKEIKKIVNDITRLQKEIVRLEHSNSDTKLKEKELGNLYLKLNNYDIYNNYIEASIVLNELITNIQNNFQEFFDNLVS